MKSSNNCWAEVNLDAIRYNISQIKELVGNDVLTMAVVKAQAYGHGLLEVSKVCSKEGVKFFGVATVDEGLILRRAGISGDILVLYDTPTQKVSRAIKNDLSISLYSLEFAKYLNFTSKKMSKIAKVHLAADTGMGWYGISSNEVLKFAKEINSFGNLKIEGIYTHCPQADSTDADKTFTKKQIKVFNDIIASLEKSGIYPKYKHMANSAATINLPEAHFNMVRPGLMIYGIYPDNVDRKKLKLEPVFSFKTKIIQVRKIPKGNPIGYSGTFVTLRDSKIAVLPIGYSDGVSRFLSNKGEVIIRGKKVSMVGNVCMNIIMVDVTDLSEVDKGDEVIIIGKDGDVEIRVDDVAQIRNTISYEVLTNLGINNRRIYLNEKGC